MIGIVSPKDSDLDQITKYVSRIFNRLMMLPVAAQVDFFEKLSGKIGELTEDQGIFSDLTAVDIPAVGFDTDVTLIQNFNWELNSGSVQIRHLKMDRILTYEMLKVNMTEHDLGFYSTSLGAVCYVVRNATKNVYHVYVPYSREQVNKKRKICLISYG